MKYHIITIGKIKEKYITLGIDEFLKRLKPYVHVKMTSFSEEKMPDRPSLAERVRILDKEGEKMVRAIKDNSYVYALDVQGELISSEQLALQLGELTVGGNSDFTFIIGGPFGLSDKVRQRADRCISFGRITLTHQMIRLLLVEQLYRAHKIQRHEPYHW